MTFLVTGANGFIGLRVVEMLERQGVIVRSAVRNLDLTSYPKKNYYAVGDIGPNTDWSVALKGTSVVIHTAARVHVMRETVQNPLDAFREINVWGTLNLARQASEAGVRRLVYISSIKVNGEATFSGRPFKASDTPVPVDPYSISKFEAEQGLLTIAAQTDMEVTIVRPPLVYGPGVKGNFASIMRILKKGIPLPLGAVDQNKRSMVAIDNLTSLLITCAFHPKAANQIFLVKDGEDLSTAGFFRRLGTAMGVPVRLVPVPEVLLRMAIKMVGRSDIAQRLCGNLQIDDGPTRDLLSWTPVVTVDEGLRAACIINKL